MDLELKNDELMSSEQDLDMNNSFQNLPEIRMELLNQNKILNKNNSHLYKNNRPLSCQTLNILNSLSPIKSETYNVPESIFSLLKDDDDPVLTESLLSSGFNESDSKRNDTLPPTVEIDPKEIKPPPSALITTNPASPILSKTVKAKNFPKPSCSKNEEISSNILNEKMKIGSLNVDNHLPTQMMFKNISIDNFNSKHENSPLTFTKMNKSPIIHTSTPIRYKSLFKKRTHFPNAGYEHAFTGENIENLSDNILTLDTNSENVPYNHDVEEHLKNANPKEFQYYPETNTTQSNQNKKITSDDLISQVKVFESVVINESKNFSNPITKSLKSDLISLSQFIKDNKSDSKLSREGQNTTIGNETKTNGKITNAYRKNSLKRPLEFPITSKAKLIKIDDSKNEFNDIDLSDSQLCKIFTEVETKFEMKNDLSSDSLENEMKNCKSRRQLCFNDCFQENKNPKANLHNDSKENELFPESAIFFKNIEKLEKDIEEIKNDWDKPSDAKRTISYSKDSKNEVQDPHEIKLTNQKKSDTLGLKTEANFSYLERFSTASGKNVVFPDKGLHQARRIFAESANETPKSSNISSINVTPMSLNMSTSGKSGFSTASGKKVVFSEKSLLQARRIFAESANETPKSSNISSINVTPMSLNMSTSGKSGFSTASGKKVVFSEKSLLQARRIFAESANETPKSSNISSNNETPMSLNMSTSGKSGFSTASGKKVVFSEKSLHQARRIFAESANETPKSSNISSINVTPMSLNMSTSGKSGFSTASGKKVVFSEKSLHQARRIFAESANETPKSSNISSINVTPMSLNMSTSGKSGFSTASGKKVVFSEKSLHQARRIFAESANETPKSSNISSINVTPMSLNMSTSGKSGFSTASGKKVVFSEKSLLQARRIFAESANETPKSSNISSNNETPMSLNMSTSGKSGFSTASGKKVVFSEKSLLQARRIFAESANETPKSSNISSNNETPMSLNMSTSGKSGFSTASGKKVVFSEKSLHQAREIFAEADIDTTKSAYISEFATASGKKLNMSENNLTKANKIFEQINDDTELLESYKEQAGFSTASGKKFVFSERSVPKARQIFADTANETPKSGFITAEKKCDISENNRIKAKRLFGDMDNETPKTKKNLGGFSTTSGKNVVVSEKSLQKARQIYAESGDETPKSSTASRFENTSGNKLNANLIKTMKRFERKVNDNDDDNETPKPGRGLFPESTYETPKSSDASKKKFGISERNTKDEQNVYKENVQNLFEDDISDSDFCEALKKSEKKDFHAKDIEQKQNPPSSQMKENKSCRIDQFLDDEVNEITAAFMEDEFKESKMKWTVPIISEPEIILDRHSGVAPPYVSKSNSPRSKRSISPILNSFDRTTKNKERLAKIKALLSQRAKEDNLSAESSNKSASNFKVPYKTNESGEKLPPSNNCIKDKTYVFKNIFHKENAEYNQTKSTKLPTMEEVKEGREQARKLQCREIALSRRNASSIKPLPGSWYLSKVNQFENRKSWKQMINGEQPAAKYSYQQLIELGVKKNVIQVTSENANDFRFILNDYYSESTCTYNIDGIEVGDGSKLVPASDGAAGLEEISLAFLSSPGISPSLVHDGWIKNHYRWLVWKFSAMERSFPCHFGTRALTPNNVLLQLKYRYDREIDKAERPALRKILERDDSASKRMTLCVASIKQLDSNQSANTSLQNTSLQFQNSGLYELELTDGWYSVWATIDSAMNSLISHEKIVVGTKLLIHGAELSGAQQGCMPLETEANQARLRLSTNSTRRARWDSKLGFCQNPFPFLISLSSIKPQGGIIGRARIVILRVYPLLYVEKFTDGSRSVTRSERSEKQEAANFERKRQSSLEDAYARARSELETTESEPPKKAQKLDPKNVALLSAGEDLCQAMESSSDPSSYQKMLSCEQMRALESYRQEKQVKLYENIELKVKEYLEKNKCPVKRNVSILFKVRIMDLYDTLSPRTMLLSIWGPTDETVSFLKEANAFDIYNLSCSRNRDNAIQLSSMRSTRYLPLKMVNLITPRQALSFRNLYDSDYKPYCGELDVVGLVVHLEEGPGSFETVYLSNEESIIIGVCFWGGLKAFSCEQLIKSKMLIAASNLQWRSGTCVKWIPCIYVTELSTFTLHPRANHLVEAQERLRKALPKNLDEFANECQSKIRSLLKEKIRPKLPIESPTNEQLNSNIQRRISKLEMYGDAPSLAPIVLSKSKKRRCGLSRRSDFQQPKRKLIPTSPPESPPLSLESSL